MSKTYIVIKEYDEKLAKRQPWYSIKYMIQELEKNGCSVEVISSVDEVPKSFIGTVVKVFSLKDCFSRRNNGCKLVYLITFPLYRSTKFLKIPIKTIIENWKDLKRIFIVSLFPKNLVKSTLRRADKVVVISDRSENFLRSYVQTSKIIPFSFNNWGGVKKQKTERKLTTIGYFGPPFTTRNFDNIIDFMVWTNDKSLGYGKKIITRIERNELKHTEKKYLSKIKQDPNLRIVSGFLDRETLASELMEIDVLLLPFKIVMSEFPVVVLEALELGIPVITTEDCGIANIGSEQENLLVLKDFTRKRYPDIIKFIENSHKDDFEGLKLKIKELNNNTISNISCLN